ncbi:MAG: filamentous hemagglutinin N-terminal domain-containing protein [Chlorobiaceae bacterium]|nr:filamentous hemagglutinin N-terminal domain-containing protein [Chlorobiaceae bacterium]
MNKVYNLIWSKTKERWVVVSERVKGNGKVPSSPLLSLAVATMLLGSGKSAHALDSGALPTGGQITAGSGSITAIGSRMTVNQSSQQLIANWITFNIGQDATVRFNQPGATASALNRITDQNPSQILGSLSANGQLFLINPSGIIFGKTAQVNVGSLVASSLNMLDSDFLAGKYKFTNDGIAGYVINQGSINASNGGVVALMAPKVTNEGSLTANGGGVLLAAGNQVSLDFTGDGLLSYTVDKGAVDALVENKGLIKADGGAVVMTSRAAGALKMATTSNSGVIEARTMQNRAGRILLLSDMDNGQTTVSGTLDASAPDGGDGGFIETSGRAVNITGSASITTAATGGQGGRWLIDPYDFTIAASGGNITGTGLGSALNSSSVTIQTAAGTDSAANLYTSASGNGDINVNDPVSWSENNTLTLNAYRNININQSISASGSSGTLALLYGQGAVAAGNTATYNVNAPVSLQAGTNFSTRLGSDGTLITYTVITSLGSSGSTTKTDLQGMNGNLAGNYALGSSFDASGTSTWNTNLGFSSIGYASPFTGIFEGLGNTISNLKLTFGLFGVNSGTIRDVVLRTPSVIGGWNNNFGALVAQNTSTGRIFGNTLSGGSIANTYSYDVIGGLVGYNTGTISGNTVSGVSVIGSALFSYVGGLVGHNTGTISGNTVSSGSMSGYSYVGGLVGGNAGTISGNTVSSGSVSGSNTVGGLVGYNTGGSISGNTVSSGSVSGSGGTVGGLVGNNYGTGASISGNTVSGVSVSGSGGTIGGLVGFNSANGVTISGNTVSGGSVSGVGSNVGGLVGYNAGSGVTISGNTVSGVSVNGGGNYVGGLVGLNGTSLGTAANISGNTVSGVSVSGGGNVGGLVGRISGGSISGNTVSGVSVSGGGSVGGLAGSNSGSISGNTVSGVSVSGGSSNDFGGLVGWNNGSISGNTVSCGSVSGVGSHVGGMVGNNYGGSISGNTVSGVSVSGGSYVGGLVGINVTSNGTGSGTGGSISGNTVSGVSVSGGVGNNVGGLVGSNTYGSISGNTVSGVSVSGGSNNVGGLVGDNTGGSISGNTVSGGSVTGNTQIGGLVGSNISGSISGNTVSGMSVTGRGNYVGGLVGYNTGTISGNTVSGGSVSGSGIVGGLVGYNAGSITGSTVSGVSVSGGGTYIGGLVGYNAGSITGSTVSGGSVSGGSFVGGLLGYNTGSITSGALVDASVSGAGGLVNYSISSQSKWTNVTPVILRITGGSTTSTYTGGVLSNDTTYTYSSSGVSVTGSVSGKATGTNVGTYTDSLSGITVNGANASYYAISYQNGSLTITPASLTITGATTTGTYSGGALINTYTTTGLLGSDSVTSVSGLATGTNVGTYNETLSGATGSGLGNYTISYVNGSLQIKPRSLTITGATTTGTYSGGALINTYTTTGLLGSDSVTSVSGLATGTTVATYTDNLTSATGSGLTNYTISYVNGSLQIKQQPLNLTVSKVYDGSAGFSSGFTLSGQVSGESPKVSGSASVSSADASSYTGFSSSSLSLSSSNYTLTGGTVSATITQRPITITAASGQGKIYGNSDAGLTYTIESNGTDRGLVSGDSFSGTLHRATGENVGSYGIDQGTLANGNYSISYTAADYAITQRPITITAASGQGKIYGNSDAGLTYTIESNGTDRGLVSGDSFSGALHRATGENVGSYGIGQGTLSNGNYSISYTAADYAITQRPLNLTVSKTYDGSASFSSGFTLSGQVSGESPTVSGSALVSSADANSYTGFSSSSLSLSSSNYTLTGGTVSAAIQPASLTIRAKNDAKTYGEVKTYGSGSTAFTLSSLQNGETIGSVTITDTDSGGLAGANADGSYALTPSQATGGTFNPNNYNISYQNGSLTVNKASLTITGATTTSTYTGGARINTYTASGLLGSDSVTGVNGLASGTGAGTYADALSGATGSGLSNYDIRYQNGSLNIAGVMTTPATTKQSSAVSAASNQGNPGSLTKNEGSLANSGTASAVATGASESGSQTGGTETGSTTTTGSNTTSNGIASNENTGAGAGSTASGGKSLDSSTSTATAKTGTSGTSAGKAGLNPASKGTRPDAGSVIQAVASSTQGSAFDFGLTEQAASTLVASGRPEIVTFVNDASFSGGVSLSGGGTSLADGGSKSGKRRTHAALGKSTANDSSEDSFNFGLFGTMGFFSLFLFTINGRKS